MRLRINDIEMRIPDGQWDITLGQRIAFHEQYGRELGRRFEEIAAIEDEDERDILLSDWEIDRMIQVFAFFTGYDPETVRESGMLDRVSSIYHNHLKVMFQDSDRCRTSYLWNDELWELHPPELKHGSAMKAGEFLDAKQTIKNAIDMKQDFWTYLPAICAIYLRRPGEAYQESFLYEGSERLELMRSLPLDIAMEVGFFFLRSTNRSAASRSFSPPGSKAEAETVGSISIGGDGSTFSNRLRHRRCLISPGLIASTRSGYHPFSMS